MSEFAEYAPDAEREDRFAVRRKLIIRPAQESDLPAVAAIAAAREGEPVAGWIDKMKQVGAEGRAGRAILYAASLDGRVIGYARAGYFAAPAGSPANVVPEGWYLTGVVVEPSMRRRGVGSELTRARLDWVAERSDCAYYVANERNLVSIDLHAGLGFVELTRDFHHPGVEFAGGRGILFVCDLRAVRR